MSLNEEPRISPLGIRQAPRRRKVLIGVAIGAAAVLGAVGTGVGTIAMMRGVYSLASSSTSSSGQTLTLPNGTGNGFGGTGGTGSSGGFGNGFGQVAPGTGGSTGSGSIGTNAAVTPATDDQKVGVVTILTTVDYNDQSKAAGTGMIMTSGGLVLTNNHVIDNSTSIAVTVESTGTTYTAVLVGTDSTNDVAVLQLVDSSGRDVTGLQTVKFDTNGTTAVGDSIYSVGNAEGTGDLVTAVGTVSATNESIKVGNEYTGATESLTGLIRLASTVVSGDSGGPLFDGQGEVIGIVTAASSGSATVVGYAIDIDAALAVVKQIETGTKTSTVQIGYPAFLGVQIARASGGTTTTGGVPVGGVFAGLPAATVGLVAGDTITAIDGTPVADAAALTAIVAAHSAGDQVVITWTDAAGAGHTGTATLADGPA
ncbi:MAG: trypsin-like peptidase domain-containing protein [Burkholderiaceae bacterium]|nr:trypsin-like peptidase domain-containing protein [Microbacteriaceae bacterium]